MKYNASVKQFTILCTDGLARKIVNSNYLGAKLDLKRQGFKPIQLLFSQSTF